jgi:hypothetical protein
MGHIAFPNIISEMKNPKDFPKALAMLYITTISMYVFVAVTVYHFASQAVKAPALGSASPLVGKIAYGIAIPTIIVAGVIYALVASKSVYRHIWSKQPKVMSEKSFRARSTWLLTVGTVWILAWLVANTIPVFSDLLAFIGAAFGTWFALGFSSMMCFHSNRRELRTLWVERRVLGRLGLLTGLNVVIVLISALLVGLNSSADRNVFDC